MERKRKSIVSASVANHRAATHVRRAGKQNVSARAAVVGKLLAAHHVFWKDLFEGAGLNVDELEFKQVHGLKRLVRSDGTGANDIEAKLAQGVMAVVSKLGVEAVRCYSREQQLTVFAAAEHDQRTLLRLASDANGPIGPLFESGKLSISGPVFLWEDAESARQDQDRIFERWKKIEGASQLNVTRTEQGWRMSHQSVPEWLPIECGDVPGEVSTARMWAVMTRQSTVLEVHPDAGGPLLSLLERGQAQLYGSLADEATRVIGRR